MEKTPLPDNGSELGSFGNLPDELLLHLFSFIPKAKSMKEIFKKLAQLSLVNSKFKEIAEDKALIKQLAERYVKFHPEKAEREFLSSVEFFGEDNCPKEYKKIVSSLAYSMRYAFKSRMLIEATQLGNRKLIKLLLRC